MREIALFVEDHAHQQVIGALLNRIAGEFSSEMAIVTDAIMIESDIRSSG